MQMRHIFWTALEQCAHDTYYAITTNARYGRTFLTGRLREIPPWPEMGGQHPDMVCWPLGHILVPLNDPEVNLAFSAFTASETASLSSI